MKIKRLTILIITLIFTIFLVGCPGSRQEFLEPNEYGFYDGYYVYKTEVYIENFLDRELQYNIDNLADGEAKYITADSYKYVEFKDIDKLNPLTTPNQEELTFDFSTIEKAYCIYSEDDDTEIASNMILIDSEKQLYWATGSFKYNDKKSYLSLFLVIDLYERIPFSDDVLDTYNQELYISSEDFLKTIDIDDYLSVGVFQLSNFYNTFKDNIVYFGNIYSYYLKINNNFVFRIFEDKYADSVLELLYIKENRIVETVRDFNLFEAFIYTNTHKLYTETNNIVMNDILDNTNNDPSCMYYKFNNLEILNKYSISRSLDAILMIIKENPEPSEISLFIEIIKELIFVKCEEDIKLNGYGMYNICIDDNIMYMNIIKGRYYMIVNECLYELINPTIDFLSACYIFNDYRYR